MRGYIWSLFAQIEVEQSRIGIPRGNLSETSIASALRLVFGVAGGVAVLIITLAALQYVTSGGDPQSTAKAKNTILYALIGLVICIMAFTIVTFTLGRI